MGRIAKIALYAVVILMLYLWISQLVKSCGNTTKAPNTAQTTEILDQEVDFDENTTEEADDFFENVDDDDIDVSESTDDGDYSFEGEVVEEIDYSELDKEIDNDDTTDEVTTSNSGGSSSSSTTFQASSSGSFLVIAGSYLIKDNANGMRNKLNNLGFSAEVAVFDLSEYHSVIAGRYRTYDEASEVSSKLKRQGIDSYVHRRKY